MGSILTSGAGLDGVLIPGNGAFVKMGIANAGLCAEGDLNSRMDEVASATIYQGTEADITALHSAVSGTARQQIFLNAALVAPTEYRVGDEVSLGDRNAAERGDLHNITKMSAVIATGWTMLRDGQWVSPTGAVLANLPTSLGTGISLGSDNTSGVGTEYWYQYGATGIGNSTINRA